MTMHHCCIRSLRRTNMKSWRSSRSALMGVGIIGFIGGVLMWQFQKAAIAREDHRPLSLLHVGAQKGAIGGEEQHLLERRIWEYCHRSLLRTADRPASSSSLEEEDGEGRLPATLLQPALELVQVHVITRHGDRSPAHKFDMGARQNFTCGLERKRWADLKKFPVRALPPSSGLNLADFPVFPGPPGRGCGVGMLTEVGFRQLHALGAAIRGRYRDFAATVRADQIFVHSTSFQRTVQSAAAFLLGYSRAAYAAGKDKEDREGENAGIPIHVSKGDLLSAPPIGVSTAYAPCPNLGAFYTKTYRGSPDFYRWEPLLRSVQDTFGLDLGHVRSTGSEVTIKLADHVMAGLCHGFAYPCNDRKECLNASSALGLVRAADEAWTHRYGHEYSRVAVRPLVLHALEAMEGAVATKSRATFRLLLSFAHDSTIAMVMNVLGAKVERWMPYASRVVMELWRSEGRGHYVRVLFNGRDVTGRIAEQGKLRQEYPGLVDYGQWRDAVIREASEALYKQCADMAA